MTDFTTWHATTPSPTPADELDRGAALAMGLSAQRAYALTHPDQIDDLAWHPSRDPAQALEFAQATADALGISGIERWLSGLRGVDCDTFASALTTACLDAWRAREGV